MHSGHPSEGERNTAAHLELHLRYTSIGDMFFNPAHVLEWHATAAAVAAAGGGASAAGKIVY